MDTSAGIIPAVQLGMMTLIAYIGKLLSEVGILQTIAIIAVQVSMPFALHRDLNRDADQVISGSIAFFIFKQQTGASAFAEGLYGSSRCADANREPSLKRHSFLTLYARYSRTHFYFGYALVWLCSFLAVLDVPGYASATFGAWIVAFSLLFAPFWFNPYQFTLQEAKDDCVHYQKWLHGELVDPDSKLTWSAWHDRWMVEKTNAANEFDPDINDGTIWQKVAEKATVWIYRLIFTGSEEEDETMEEGEQTEENNTEGNVSSTKPSSTRNRQMAVCRRQTLFSKGLSIFSSACSIWTKWKEI